MTNKHITPEMIIGIDCGHLVTFKNNIKINRNIQKPLLKLIDLAKDSGIELAIASGYRSFDRQKEIWNEKMEGIRPIYDDRGNLLNIDTLNEDEKIHAILRWSALPGLSRHHFGTDLDIYDKHQTDIQSYQLQLIPSEYESGGIFENLSTFLEKTFEIETKFSRPYLTDNGGIAPEPWHISFTPIATSFIKKFNIDFLIQTMESSDIIGKKSILKYLKISKNLDFDNLIPNIRSII